MTPTPPRRRADQGLRALLEPVVLGAGFDLEDLAEQRGGSRRLVRLTVDSDHGVSLDETAQISRLVSEALDASDAMGDAPYFLEVSSPGVDRPLALPRHWRRAVGRLVKVVPAAGAEVLGRVLAADGESVTVEVDGAERVLPYAGIARARVQVEFNRPDADPADEDGFEDEDEGDDLGEVIGDPDGDGAGQDDDGDDGAPDDAERAADQDERS
jgi:ribosome maturation factor RimP